MHINLSGFARRSSSSRVSPTSAKFILLAKLAVAKAMASEVGVEGFAPSISRSRTVRLRLLGHTPLEIKDRKRS